MTADARYGSLINPQGFVERVAVVPATVTDLHQYVIDCGVMPYIPPGYSMALSDAPPAIGAFHRGDGVFVSPWLDVGEPGQEDSFGYALGHRVWHAGKVWESAASENFDEPGFGAWEEI